MQRSVCSFAKEIVLGNTIFTQAARGCIDKSGPVDKSLKVLWQCQKVQQHPSKDSLSMKRRICGRNDDVLMRVLGIEPILVSAGLAVQLWTISVFGNVMRWPKFSRV